MGQDEEGQHVTKSSGFFGRKEKTQKAVALTRRIGIGREMIELR